MKKRKLGSQGLEVSAQGLGCMGMTDFYGVPDDKESIATIKLALELGVTLIDTADMYGPFTNEELVGKAIRGRRNDVILASKFGIVRSSDPKFRALNGRHKYVLSSCDGSLKRLGVDYLDLYYYHRIDPDVPVEETVDAMSQLVKAGKVRYIGLSEASPKNIRRAHAVHPITALQTEYSLWSRNVEKEILPAVRELGIGFVAYSPLGRGFLTGTISNPDDFPDDDYRRGCPWFQKENFHKNLELVERIKKIAKEKEATPAQLAIAWVHAQGEDIIPIPGTKKRKYLEENVAANRIVLSRKELDYIDEIMPPSEVKGQRYPEKIMKMLDS